jgi:hypothetical protein
MHIQVETAAGAKGEVTPSSLHFDGRNIDVTDVVDRWWGAGDRYFKVTDSAQNTYVIRFDEQTGGWELLMFLSKRGAAIPEMLVKLTSPRVPRSSDGQA